MKKLFVFIAFLFATANSFAQSTVYVSGYTKSNGTYVQPHYRTSPNSTRNDNYSTVGNVNPYTSQEGTKPRDYETSTYTAPTYTNTSTSKSPTYTTPTYTNTATYDTPSYSTTTPVYTGTRGGQYYINSNGNKTYISR
jgi:hypothetical protein